MFLIFIVKMSYSIVLLSGTFENVMLNLHDTNIFEYYTCSTVSCMRAVFK